MKKLIPVFAAAFCTFLALAFCFCTVLGYVQDVIHFNGIGSELVFLSFTFLLGIMGIAWTVQEKRQIAIDRQFRAEAFNSLKFKANMAGTSYSYMQDIEVQADRFEEQERLKQYFNS
jgi:hypothetical protein